MSFYQLGHVNYKIKNFSQNIGKYITEGAPNLSADRVRTVPYPSAFRVGSFWSTAQRTALF
jgi:hypothetical protein